MRFYLFYICQETQILREEIGHIAFGELHESGFY
jgi:hypothetical protein